MNPAEYVDMFRSARYLTTAVTLEQLPPDRGREIAVIGRSNAGKSSIINALAGIGNLARTSRTPGRTRELIVFSVGAQRRIVDLPGYGYSAAPSSKRREWQETIPRYFETRRSLHGVVMAMDIRHPLKPVDLAVLDLLGTRGGELHVVLTKADKLGRGAACAALRQVEIALAELGDPAVASARVVSAKSGLGVDELRQVLARCLGGGAGQKKRWPR
jgi:GTP-binding protein